MLSTLANDVLLMLVNPQLFALFSVSASLWPTVANVESCIEKCNVDRCGDEIWRRQPGAYV